MPDLASLMVSSVTPRTEPGSPIDADLLPSLARSRPQNNPQMAAMAQQMMQNGGLEQLMQNPMLRRMAENMGSGGGMPDMSQLGALMQDPQMRQLAQQFAGGMGRGGGQGGQGGQGGNPGNMFG
ncbi:hypothetical protein BDZ90DRAFT_229113 [Jaminaea rosea]|uniref:STI1 domain-containing protein n=1 Tax=Jaminaea rosea TaxID=1569628 RepID=A0A316UYL5_9BASI|nr:hypothetical protein BDZ90DRAFT_229113 [Jaminaea rosea]PWN30084.1 hypothetical protein BDZ90DRAFT_229113 [Jaminaea rosea]